MSIEDPIEKQLTGIHLENYRKRCRAHPWYREAQMLIKKWNQKVDALLEAGQDPEILYDEPYKLPIDEEIGFALAVQATPDIWVYFKAQVESLVKDPESGWHPELLELIGPFGCWYRMHRGKAAPQGAQLFAGRAIIQKYLKGELPSLDGPEARAFALCPPWESQ